MHTCLRALDLADGGSVHRIGLLDLLSHWWLMFVVSWLVVVEDPNDAPVCASVGHCHPGGGVRASAIVFRTS